MEFVFTTYNQGNLKTVLFNVLLSDPPLHEWYAQFTTVNPTVPNGTQPFFDVVVSLQSWLAQFCSNLTRILYLWTFISRFLLYQMFNDCQKNKTSNTAFQVDKGETCRKCPGRSSIFTRNPASAGADRKTFGCNGFRSTKLNISFE